MNNEYVKIMYVFKKTRISDFRNACDNEKLFTYEEIGNYINKTGSYIHKIFNSTRYISKKTVTELCKTLPINLNWFEKYKKTREDMKLEITNVMTVSQLPELANKFKLLNEEIVSDLKYVNDLTVTEENRKEIKIIRTATSKSAKEMKMKYKIIEDQVMAPINEFKNMFKDLVETPYKEADTTLKEKITSVEKILIDEKTENLVAYFNEKCISANIDFVTFENIIEKINFSSTENSLMKKIDIFMNQLVQDMRVLDTFKEIDFLVEYKKDFNLSESISIVQDRMKKKAIEEQEMKKRIEQEIEQEKIDKEKRKLAKEQFQAQQFNAPVQEVQEVQEEIKIETKTVIEKIVIKTESNNNDIHTYTLKITHNKQKMKELKKYLNEGGYIYVKQ